jgi:hypothetical protein
MQCALRLWRAVVWHGSCANILLRFRPGPGNHDCPPRYDMISGALFFLDLTLHRLAPSVDLTITSVVAFTASDALSAFLRPQPQNNMY